MPTREEVHLRHYHEVTKSIKPIANCNAGTETLDHRTNASGRLVNVVNLYQWNMHSYGALSAEHPSTNIE
jgi:hypothetical protein